MASVFKRGRDKGRRGSRWVAVYTDENGQRRMRAGYTDRRETQRLAERLEDQARQMRDGLIDPAAERRAEHGRRPLAKHRDDFAADLRSRGTSEKQVKRLTRAIDAAGSDCEWGTIRDIDSGSFARHVEALKARGLSAAAINRRIAACKQFARWLVNSHRLAADPMAGVRMIGAPQADARLRRRAMTDTEIRKLLTYAETAPEIVSIPKRCRVGGELREHNRYVRVPNRSALYGLALGTGLRLAEIRSLTPHSFRLDADPPYVRVSPGYVKNRKPVEQPIRRDLAERLRALVGSSPKNKTLWSDLPDSMAAVLRADLIGAGVAPEDDEGRRIDFHSLRHTYVTRLAMSDAPIRVAMQLARHSDPRLTMKVYSHVVLADSSKALESLPGESSEATPEREAAG